MKPKFRKGDRVRFIGDCVDQGVSYDEFTVTEDSDDKRTDVERYVYEELRISNDELELVESFDKKTAFLTELKELMEKYQVSSIGDWEDEDATWEPKEIRFNDGSKIQFFSSCITPSNIFNYDK